MIVDAGGKKNEDNGLRTAPPWIISDLLSNFFGPGRTPVIVKQVTNRCNIGYSASICSDDGIDALVSRIKSKITYYTSEDRRIVFIPAVDLFVQVKGMLSISSISCVTYSGRQEDTENVANFAAWKDGEVKLMVATSSFGVGIDYPNVRDVTLFGLPSLAHRYCTSVPRISRAGT